MTSNSKSKTIYINMYNPESLEESVNKLQREIVKISNNIEIHKKMKPIELIPDYLYNDYMLKMIPKDFYNDFTNDFI